MRDPSKSPGCRAKGTPNPRPLECHVSPDVRRSATTAEKFRNTGPPGPFVSVVLDGLPVGVQKNADNRRFIREAVDRSHPRRLQLSAPRAHVADRILLKGESRWRST